MGKSTGVLIQVRTSTVSLNTSTNSRLHTYLPRIRVQMTTFWADGLAVNKLPREMDIYSHVVPSMQKDAVKRFAMALET